MGDDRGWHRCQPSRRADICARLRGRPHDGCSGKRREGCPLSEGRPGYPEEARWPFCDIEERYSYVTPDSSLLEENWARPLSTRLLASVVRAAIIRKMCVWLAVEVSLDGTGPMIEETSPPRSVVN